MTTNTRKWPDAVLTLVLAAAAATGLAFVVASGPIVELFDKLYLDAEVRAGRSAAELDYVRGLYAVLGAVMVGWIVALVPIARGPIRRRERWAWNLIVSSAVAWFVLDTAASLVFMPRNAILNLIFIVGFGIALIPMRRELR